MRIRFLYTKKPRQFEYKPRYWDPEKELREKRREELLGRRPVDGEYVPGSIIRGKADIRRENVQDKRRGQRGKTLKLALLMVLIVAAAYFILR